MIDRTNGTRGFVRKRARECSSTRALKPSHSTTTRALELLHSSTRVLELEKYSHTTRMTSANHSREFFHSRISSTRPVLYMIFNPPSQPSCKAGHPDAWRCSRVFTVRVWCFFLSSLSLRLTQLVCCIHVFSCTCT